MKQRQSPPISEQTVLDDMKQQALQFKERYNLKSVTITRRVKLGYAKIEKTLSVTV